MISIDNMDSICDQFVDKKKHKNINELAPQHPFRLLIIGPSGAGKTNIVMNLVIKYLCFDKIYIFAKDLQEEKYLMMIALFQNLEKEYQKINETDDKLVKFSDDLNSVDIDSFDGNKQNLV